MAKTIRKHPDPSVRTKCTPVEVFGPDVAKLSEELYESLHASERPGVGLSANQIGDFRRVFLIDTKGQMAPTLFVNPEISKGRILKAAVEGCLSCEPADDRRVLRFEIINWKAQDANGKHISGKARGFIARIIQHEIDHLNGILITDKPRA